MLEEMVGKEKKRERNQENLKKEEEQENIKYRWDNLSKK
jgi:hypothetical protein